MNVKLTPELEKIRNTVLEKAKSLGLSFFPIEFLLVSPRDLNNIAAYEGFPKRMGHWKFGQEFEILHKKYKHGLAKIYELVINNDPVYAYLMNTNPVVDQKLVMAHVCGHADFFYNNMWFKDTDRNMLDQMANNAVKVERMVEKHGVTEIENFINICFSLSNLIDPYSEKSQRYLFKEVEETPNIETPVKLPAKNYMDSYINPKEYIDLQKKQIEDNKEKKKKFPECPERDVLGFLIQHAPMERWQRDIMGMVREESYYFMPQRLTKVSNEGYASFWHSKLMTEHLAESKDIVDYCSVHAGVLSSPGFNPYKIGIEIWRDIEDRWNRGAHGPKWEACESYEEKKNWNTHENKGLEQVKLLRKSCNDLTLLDDYLTPEFCKEQKLFSYKKPDPDFGYSEISEEFSKIKKQLLLKFSNGGLPVIKLVDANYQNKGELLLVHINDGRYLDRNMGQDTLHNLYKVWTRPVHLVTADSDEPTRDETWHFDGSQHWITR